MSNRDNVFNKLYSQVVNERHGEEEAEFGIDPNEDRGYIDDEEEMEGDEETVSIPVSLARKIVDELKYSLGDDEDEFEDDFEDDEYGDELDDDLTMREENEYTNQGSKPGIDPRKSKKTKTELPDDALGGKSKGMGNAKATDKVGNTNTPQGNKPGVSPSKKRK